MQCSSLSHGSGWRYIFSTTIAPGCTCESTREAMAPEPGSLQSRGSTSQRMTRSKPIAAEALVTAESMAPYGGRQ